MQKILVSACLLGEIVRYDGKSARSDAELLMQWRDEERLVPICPEVAGGLPVPRPPAEIVGGDAESVLRGRNSMLRQDGTDVTDAFVDGAEKALALCMKHHIRVAILKEGSPSCAVNLVNDGSFQKHKINGMGVTARLLQRHGIAVFSELQLKDAQLQLHAMEAAKDALKKSEFS